ncbi:MAG: dockerin type I domain-containing protein [Candidatus Zixiibacteriota bacterium]
MRNFILILALSSICVGISWADNKIDITVATHTGGDTIWIGVDADFYVHIENDELIKELNLGFKVWSPEGAVWDWADVGEWGPEDKKFVTVLYSTRMENPNEIWDNTGFIVYDTDLDGNSPDFIRMGGEATNNGLESGPLEEVLLFHFNIECGGEHTICIDTAFIPPDGDLVFRNEVGTNISPIQLWPEGGLCVPIQYPRCYPPQLVSEQYGSVSTTKCQPVTLYNAVTWEDPEGDYITIELRELIGGDGEVIINDHEDGTCDITYVPVASDAGKVIEAVIRASGMSKCAYSCEDYYHLNINVSNQSTSEVYSDIRYEQASPDLPFYKNDFSVIDPDSCDSYNYSIVSGPGDIDEITGEYSWTPTVEDAGLHAVTISVTDGMSPPVECGFDIEVLDFVCEVAGDANTDGQANVGDAVFLINNIFKGGPAPANKPATDVNRDCNINIGDAVFLINHIFKNGPRPYCSGCVLD